MAQTLKLKRGNSDNFPSLTLEAGEPAFVLNTGKLYIGDGTNKVLINPDETGKSETADKLTTPRAISLTGDVTGSANFDGSANAPIAATLANSGVTAGTHTKVTVDAKGRVTAGATLAAGDIPNLTRAKITDLGTAAAANTGTATGNVPILDANGKLNQAVLPALAITDTFVVATQAAMLALSNAETGDIAVRTDLNKCYILTAAPSSTLANWQELLNPESPVQSVAGKTGVVTLAKADVGLANVPNEDWKTASLTVTADTATNTTSDTAAKTGTLIAHFNWLRQKVNGLISALSGKQNNIAAGTSGKLLTSSGTAGTVNEAGTVGSTTAPVYLNAGVPTALTQANLRIGTIGTTAIGSTTLPVYFAANGVPTAYTAAQKNSMVQGATIAAPTLTNAAIATGDTVQVALGKLQAQVNTIDGGTF